MDTVMETTDECGRPLKDQDILDFLFFLILGAFETTSVFLTNVLKFLSENPHVVDELRVSKLFSYFLYMCIATSIIIYKKK